MKKIINGVIISISIVLIGFVILFSLLPNIVLNVIVTLCGFTIPIFLIITTMIVEIKKSKNMKEKDKIRNFWLKVLFIIYCLLLITVLFLNNEYRMHAFQNINTNTFSKEHFEIINYLWDNEVYADDNSLSVIITRIREKIKELGIDNFIETKRGQGYKL